MSDDFQGRGGSPWGTPPGGGNGSGKGPTPPDIDALIRDIQSKINRFLPGGSSSGKKPIGLILIIIAFVWLASGLYRVGPDEQGVVLRFGKFVKTTQPGLHYHIPLPVRPSAVRTAERYLSARHTLRMAWRIRRGGIRRCTVSSRY